jgi:hypothetical protein
VPYTAAVDPVLELGYCDPGGRDALRAMYGDSHDITYTDPVTGVSTTVTYQLPDCHTNTTGPAPPVGGGSGGS